MDAEESFDTSLLSGVFATPTPHPATSTTPRSATPATPQPIETCTTPPAVVKKKFKFRHPTSSDNLGHRLIATTPQNNNSSLSFSLLGSDQQSHNTSLVSAQQQQQQQPPQQPQQPRQQPLSTQQRMTTTKKENGKRIFLVTYSQADTVRFPTRKSFARFVVTAFNHGVGKAKVVKWAVCREPHVEGGVHYHVSIKMNDLKRWSMAQRWMAGNGVHCDIQDQHDHYVSMYRYVMKMDELAVDEEGKTPANNHLQTIASPKTKSCNAANRKRRGSAPESHQSQQHSPSCQSSQPPRSRARNMKLTHVDVGEFVVKNNINNYT